MKRMERGATVKGRILRRERKGAEILMVLNKPRYDEAGKLTKPAGWGMPGGRFDPFQDGDFVDTAFREIKEETGLDVCVDPDSVIPPEENPEYDIYVLDCALKGGKIRRRAEEIDDVDWVSLMTISQPSRWEGNRAIYEHKGKPIYSGDRRRILASLKNE